MQEQILQLSCHRKTGRGNVPVARNPIPKPHKTPKSNYPQKQHDTVIKFPLFFHSFWSPSPNTRLTFKTAYPEGSVPSQKRRNLIITPTPDKRTF